MSNEIQFPDCQANLEFRYRLALREIRSAESPATIRHAVAELRRCGELGHPDAQFELGSMYKLGQEVYPDPVQAIMWFMRANRRWQGDVDATIEIVLLSEAMRPDEYERAILWADQEDARWGTPRTRVSPARRRSSRQPQR